MKGSEQPENTEQKLSNEYNIVKIEPRWNHRYANHPDIIVTLDEDIAVTKEWIWKAVPDENAREKTMLLSTNNAPWVKFVYIDNPKGRPETHGALGGKYKMANGETFVSTSGWSSRCGVVQRDYREFLEDDLVDVSLKVPGWNTLWAGFNIYRSALINHECWPKDLYLVADENYLHNEVYHTISIDPTTVKKAPNVE